MHGPFEGVRFARWVFGVASVWGVLVLTPMYWTFDLTGKLSPPPVNHPEYYYGFVGVALAWQFAFFVIARDPVRFRPLMIPAIFEKLSFVVAIAVLLAQKRVSVVQSLGAGPDAILAVLFSLAFFKLRPRDAERSA